MSSIDERVVEMKFNNGAFEQGAATTMGTLDKLKQKLNFTGASKGLEQIATATNNNRTALSTMSQGVDFIASRFSAMGIIAITTLTNIVNKAINAGTQLVKSLTIDPVNAGLKEYETNLNAIQTILANTQASGATLKDVNGKLKELNEYSDQTIYNFAEMAKNIGTFTAAGVDLDTSTSAIKGIANLAALSGSNSQQASTAMYQLSQALSAGRVSLQDWNSVVNAGMGGAVFQRALAQTAEKMGTLDKGAVKLSGKMKNATINGQSFRESITAKPGEESWLTSEVLTSTLAQFTGDLTDAQLKAEGFSAAQIKAIQSQAKLAKSAATEVKTATQLVGTLQEAAGSGWAQTWEYIIGDFEEAKKLWTGVNNVIGGFIGASADARNKIVGDWKSLGGRTALIDGIKNAFAALMAIIKPIKDAFRDIFPAMTGKRLYELTVMFKKFTEGLKIGGGTAFKLRRVFQGVFAVLDIGWMVIKKVVDVIGNLFGAATKGSGGFLNFAARIGDWLTALRYAIKYGDGLTEFFNGLESVLRVPIQMIRSFIKFLGQLFQSDDSGALEATADRVQERFKPLGKLGEMIAAVWNKLREVFGNIWAVFSPIAQKMGDWFKNLGSSISEAMGGINFSTFLDTVNTGLFAALILTLRKWMGGMGKEADKGEGLFAKIKGALDGVTDTLKTMQTTLKSTTLLMIAAALGILVASIVALSMIDSAALTKALIAITVMFTQLIGAMVIMEKYVQSGGMVRAGVAMILLAIAIRILASAVKTLSDISWEGLAKGLVGVGGLLVALALFTKFAETQKGAVKTGAGLLLLAIGIKILASAVGDFAEMEWGDIAKGLAAISAILLAFAGFTRIVGDGKKIVSIGAAMILIGISMKIFASALKDFAEMDWETMGRGMAGMAGALLLVAGAMRLMPKNMASTAVGFAIVAASLLILANVLKSLGGMSWEEIGKGLTVLAGSLLLIAGAMFALGKAGPMGPVALILIAGALAILAPILLAFGAMSWEEIGKGLLMLAGAFTILGLAGLILTPVILPLMGLAVAIALIGLGAALAGVGVLAFAAGLTALAAAGAAGAIAIVGIVSALIGLLPMLMTQIALAIVAFAKTLAIAAPAIMQAMVVVLGALIDAIATLTPKVISTLLRMLTLMLNALVYAIPLMVRSGLKLILGILEGIRDNIGKIVTVAGQIITNFLDALAKQLPKIIQSGVNLIVSFVEGLATAIRNNSDRMNTAGGKLAGAIIDGMVSGIGKGLSAVRDAAMRLARSALDAAKSFLGINSPSKEFAQIGRWSSEGFAIGIDKYASNAAKASEGMGHEVIDSLRKSISGLSELVDANVDMNPVITPVLDLSGLQHQARGLSKFLGTPTLDVVATQKSVTAASKGYEQNQEARLDESFGTSENSVTFNQYNNSPKALSEAEIYRQTKSQLSVVKKGALTI